MLACWWTDDVERLKVNWTILIIILAYLQSDLRNWSVQGRADHTRPSLPSLPATCTSLTSHQRQHMQSLHVWPKSLRLHPDCSALVRVVLVKMSLAWHWLASHHSHWCQQEDEKEGHHSSMIQMRNLHQNWSKNLLFVDLDQMMVIFVLESSLINVLEIKCWICLHDFLFVTISSHSKLLCSLLIQ